MLEGKVNGSFSLLASGVGTLAGIATDCKIVYEMIDNHALYKGNSDMQLAVASSFVFTSVLTYLYGNLFSKLYRENFLKSKQHFFKI